MKISRLTLGVAIAAMSAATTPVLSQGTTTGGIGGTVSGSQSVPIEGAQVRVTNRSTGFTASARTRSNGSYQIQGLEVGGPYSVSVRQLGTESQARDDIRVSLSQITRVDFQLVAQAQVLAGITATSERSGALITPSRMGIGTTITDTMVSRLPSLNRDFSDFARLTPQIAVVPGSGLSGGGVNNRFNSIQIDGASESDLFGIGSTGTPGSGVSAKSISVESVKEYQVLLSPFDVRQGNFVGALINAVTKSGTNKLTGSAYGFLRDQQLTRTQDYLSAFNQKQMGFSLGGPIMKDKIFFFLNPEFQRQQQPTSGPFVGSSDATITQAQVDAVNAALAPYGIAGGTGDIIPQKNPLTNIFGRLDFNLPYSSRLKLSLNYSDGERTNFSRSTSGNFRLTSNAYDFASKKYATVGQLFTNWSSGAANELSVGYTTIDDFRSVPLVSPQITVSVPRLGGGAAVPVVAGTERSSQGNALYQTILEVADNVTFPIGTHNLTVGTKNFFYYSDNLFAQDRYGTWAFNSLDSLNGVCANCGGLPQASSYTARIPIGDQASAKFRAATYGLFIQDQWKIRPTMNLVAGLRADIPVFKDKPPFNDAFFTEYDTLTGTRAIGGGRRTNVLPSGKIEWSPRVGFNWDVTGDERNQLRAGAGVFAGPPAYVWLSNAFGNSGVSGYPAFSCSSATNATQRPPAFTQAAVNSPPTQCAGPTGVTAALGSAINLLNEDMHFPQSLKMTAGFDHRFGSEGFFGDLLEDLVGTAEVQYTRGLYTPFYKNLALIEPDPALPANRNSQGRL
ncbi:MAG: carboxypeptidase regulatory-like domain-containing protein, partial [Gemmatimonadaceae bacterium]